MNFKKKDKVQARESATSQWIEGIIDEVKNSGTPDCLIKFIRIQKPWVEFWTLPRNVKSLQCHNCGNPKPTPLSYDCPIGYDVRPVCPDDYGADPTIDYTTEYRIQLPGSPQRYTSWEHCTLLGNIDSTGQYVVRVSEPHAVLQPRVDKIIIVEPDNIRVRSPKKPKYREIKPTDSGKPIELLEAGWHPGWIYVCKDPISKLHIIKDAANYRVVEWNSIRILEE